MAEDFNQKLMTVLKETVANFNVNHDPDSSIVKAARDNNFNVEQTRRLVEVFNVARTLYHYKSASDRTTPVSLADGPSVVAALFAEPMPYLSDDLTKSASTFAFDGYDTGETFMRHVNGNTEKAASSEFDSMFVVDESFSAPTFDKLAQQAVDAIQAVRTTAKVAYDEAGACGLNAANALTKLATVFSRPYDREESDDRYSRLIALHSSDAEWAPVLSKLAEFLHPKYAAPTSLIEAVRQRNVVSTSGLDVPLKLMKEARDWMEAEAELLASSSILEKDAATFERDWSEVVHGPVATEESLSALFTFPKTAADPPGGPDKDKDKKPSKDPVSNWADSVADGVTSVVDEGGTALGPAFGGGGDSMGVRVARMFSEPRKQDNQRLTSKLNNIQREIMMRDLMMNDPVLADADPEAVASAYSNLLSLTPQVSTNKEIVRAILRQSVQSVAVSPYDADMWTRLEGNLNSLRGTGVPPPSKPETAKPAK